MKKTPRLWVPFFLFVVSACQSHPAENRAPQASTRDVIAAPGSQTQPAAASTRSIARADASRAAAGIPKHFSEYASESLSNGQRCVVGATTDEDGMNQRPVAYVTDAKSEQPVWVDKLSLPPNTFQSRATHCTSSGHSLFVLLQSDTQPEQTLSQTLLRVVKVDLATGTVRMQQETPVSGAFSTWVDVGSSHFQWKDDTLIVSGNQRPQASPDQQTTFTLRMDGDLNAVRKDQP